MGEDGNVDFYRIDIMTNLHTNVNNSYSPGVGDLITFKKAPYVWQKRHMEQDQVSNNASDIIFKIDPETVITLDGVKETAANLLNAKQKREFNSVTMSGKYVEFKIDFPGALDASSGNKLKLSYSLSEDMTSKKKRK